MGFSTVGAPPPEQPAMTATAAAAVSQRAKVFNCNEFMCAPSFAHAVHGGLGEDPLHAVVAAAEETGDLIELGAVLGRFGRRGRGTRRAETHGLEYLLDLATR